MNTKLSIVPVLALTTALTAQTTSVFPSYAANVDGQTNTAYHHLSSGVTRFQYVYDKAELTIPNAAAITGIGYRQDCATRVASTGYRLQMEIKMGATTKAQDALSATFANNYIAANPPHVVFTKQLWDLPSMPAPTATLPAPSTNKIAIPLSTPHTYDASNNLLVEFLVYATNNGNAQFAYYLDTMTHQSTSSQYGIGCTNSQNTVPLLNANTPALGSNWSTALTKATNVAPTGFFIGSGNQSWNGSPLPLDLGTFGAPGCTLHVDYQVVVGATTNASGNVTLNIPTPQNLLLNGASLYVQAASYDPFANNFGIVTSNGVKTTFGYPARSGGVYATGNVNATTGSVFANDGLVALFTY